MPRWVYRQDDTGKVFHVEHSGRLPTRGTPTEATRSFQETVLDAYKHVEENGKWQGAYASKSQIKNIHEAAAARDAETTR